jgi:hypothetical protein
LKSVSTLKEVHMTLIDILRDEPVGLRLKRIFKGLKNPKGSPEYEYAKYSLMCMYGPYAISAGASTLVVLLSMLISVGGETQVGTTYDITVEDIKSAENNIKVDEAKDVQPDVTDSDRPDLPPGPLVPEISTPGPVQPNYDTPEASPSDMGEAPLVAFQPMMSHSPIVLRNLYGNRYKGGREAALKAYGGGGGGRGKIADGTGNTTEDAVLRALRWLKKYQEADGSWNSKSGGGPGFDSSSEPALTGLALLTYLAHGETPNSEEFGQTVENAIKWLVDNEGKDGRFNKKDQHEYSQPIGTYALCEAFGMTQVPMVKDAAKNAVDVLIKGQHANGSWNYNCDPADRNDTSYSGWCAQALKAAKMAGLDNTDLDMAMRKAVEGFRLNFRKDVFWYETKGDGSEGRLTSVGVLCLQLLGYGKSTEAQAGMTWLNQNATCDWAAPWGKQPIYDWYYTTQAKFHAGGEVWTQWNNQFSVQLVTNQKVIKGAGIDGKDIGYWEGLDGLCKAYVYNTTMCTLMLEVYYRYLPTYKPTEDADKAPATASGTDDIKVEVSR